MDDKGPDLRDTATNGRGLGELTLEGRGQEHHLPRTERPDAPAYLTRYLDRRARAADADPSTTPGHPGSDLVDDPDASVPLYLRRYRGRIAAGDGATPMAAPIPGDVVPTWTEAWAMTSKSRELVEPPDVEPPATGSKAVVDVHLIRHGETQGYSTNSGLTPMGRWQAHRRGHDLSKGTPNGASMILVNAPTPRARETAEQIKRGAEQGFSLWGRDATIDGPTDVDEFRNFAVWTPSGERDVTAAYREYHAVSERYERVALGDRPLWLVEFDRFVRIQGGGGDPIHFWMVTPLMSFEPATAVVLRFWAGISRLVATAPDGARILVATHSGPIRAFATWALGHDAGEPYNVEEVRVRVRRTLTEAQVTYRTRTAQVHVPPAAEWPSWLRQSAVAGQSAVEAPTAR